jgi:ADP-heptose:LPS heptosyltransferase
MIPVITYFRDDNFRERPIRRILVLKLDHIGDFILGMPAMRRIREGFPDAHITLVCATWNRGWAEQVGWFDRIVCFDFFSSLNRNWSGTQVDLQARYDAVALLPLETYDLAVDLRYDTDTRPCLYRVDTKHRAGFYAPPSEGLPYLDLVLPLTEGGLSERGPAEAMPAGLRLQLLAVAIIAAFSPPRRHPAEALLTASPRGVQRPFAVLALSAGDPIRCWPIERYGEVGRELIARHGLDIVVLGGAVEQEDAVQLAASLPQERVRTVIDKPLVDLPLLIANAALCVCNGSGVSHLAASLGVPTVCILSGAARMSVWRPVGPNAVSIGGMTSCQPCQLKYASDCPWGVDCLTAVSTAHVLDACDRLLTAPAQPAPDRVHGVA